MLTQEEESFIKYWETNRDREKKLMRQLLIGMPLGLLISGGILFSLDLGWYERANMVASSQTNPYIILIAIVAIAVFTAIFYKKYQWDMNEQHYKELLFKKEKNQDQTSDGAAK